MPFRRTIALADRMSRAVGLTAAWSIVALTAVIGFEVFSRYVFNVPHDWVFDASNLFFGSLFMLAGAYALSQDAHVRGDLMYGSLPPRGQAGLDLVLYLLFFLPGVAALSWAGYSFAADSWAIHEGSAMTADGLPQYPLKTIIPVAGTLLLIQGLAEMLRCGVCLFTGEWPKRLADAQEVDVDEIKAALEVTPL
ncbi:TRAP transporter small permease subunit [soil metagenome]